MKATLEFNLDDRQDQVAHLRCVRNWELAWALSCIMGEISSKLENSEREDDLIDGKVLLERCSGIIEENNLFLDELIY